MGRADKFIKVHFMDGRAPEELAWTDAATLERWSTELDKTHVEARRQVDHIEIFMSHPLLEQGLVLIDTPGLQSLVEHHEFITRKAIAEAHIAIWVQSALQLGGNATEWAFLSQTIRKNFNKFITVVNMWDEILESKDPQDAGKSAQQLTHESLGKVKDNFHKHLVGQPEAELEVMTNNDHLMGVSALWALSQDDSKRAQSGVPRLAGCIRDLFSSGEALEQVYRKPLKQMLHIQEQLAQSIDDELQQLRSGDTLTQRQRDLELLNEEIKNLDLEMRNETSESQQEHRNAASYMAKQVEQQLTVPLSNLMVEINDRLTPAYIQSLVDGRVKKIGLPEQLAKHFATVSNNVEQRWHEQRREIEQSLAGLRTDYTERMAKHGSHLNAALGAVDISLPKPQVGFDLDLSPLESYHAQAAELEQAIAEHEDEVEALELQIEQQRGDPVALQAARDAFNRAQQRVDRLGPQPAPRIGTRYQEVSSGGLYSKAKFADVEYPDTSNVEAWREDKAREEAALMRTQEQLQTIIAEEQRKTGIVISNEAAKRKLDKKIAQFRQKKAEAERAYVAAQSNFVEDTLLQLKSATVGQLEQRINYLKNHVRQAIHELYEKQLELLAECVQEQYIEPLNAKRAQRESVRQLIEQGIEHVQQRRDQLTKAQAQVADLMTMTKQAGM